MSRALGQIDESKTEAILEAASVLFEERGLTASMSQIAQRAGVSKQTLYNRYASKLEIARAMAARRSEAVTAPLRSGGEPEAVLTAMAQTLLDRVCAPGKGASIRGMALISAEAPDIAHEVYLAGPGASLHQLADWLRHQTAAGRLATPDPEEAAEMFSGMVLGHAHVRAIMDMPQISAEARQQRAREAARRFLIAFSPENSEVLPEPANPANPEP